MSTTQADDDTTEPVTKTEFLNKPRWVCWRYEGDDKPPLQPWDDGPNTASTTDPTTWGTFIEANEYHTREDTDTEGVGYVLGSDDTIAAFDIDDCYDPERDQIEPWAADIIQTIDSYTEISPSGYGIRIWLIGSLPDGATNKHPQERTLDELSERDTPALEVYDANQYLTFTRDYCEFGADTLNERDDELSQVYDEYRNRSQSSQNTTQTDEHDSVTDATHTSQSSVNLADDDILELARDASNGTRFRELWYNRSGENPSVGDMALCGILSFYTQNVSQIDRLFRQSHRMRDKWDEIHYTNGDTYGEHTIATAIANQDHQYTRSSTTDHNSNSEDTGGVSETAPDSTATSTATADNTTDSKVGARAQPPTHVVDLPGSATPTEPATATRECECGIEINVTVHTTIPQHVAYDRVGETLYDAMTTDTPTLVDGICSVGKSYGTLLAAMETGVPMTILAPRHDMYDEYSEWCAEIGFADHEYQVLPSFQHDCETMTGNHGNEWKNRFETAYGKGLSPTEIHSNSREMFGEKPPCDDGQECSYKCKWNFDPDETQILIGHYTHAHVPSVTEDRVVVIDEYPDDAYVEEFDGDEVNRYIQSFLQQTDNPHFNTKRDITDSRSGSCSTQASFERWFHSDTDQSNSGRVMDTIGDCEYESTNTFRTHVDAPLLAYGFLTAEQCGPECDYEYADFATTIDGTRERVRMAIDRSDDSVQLLRLPPLEDTRTVIALDGTPVEDLWSDTFDIDFEYERILSDDEREDYIRDVLGMSIIQTTTNAHHRSGANHRASACAKDGALLEAIDAEQGTPAIIAAKPVIERYQEMDIIDRELDDDSIMWYNNLTGSNSLADESVGVVLNAELNDNEIAWRSALAGDTANRETHPNGSVVKGMDLTFDSDIANDELQRFREAQVAQAIFRIGRDDDIDESTVYVNTAAIPDWIPVDDTCEVETLTQSQQEVGSVFTNLSANESITVSELTDHDRISVGKRSIRNTLSTFEEEGLVDGERSPGTATLWKQTTKMDTLFV